MGRRAVTASGCSVCVVGEELCVDMGGRGNMMFVEEGKMTPGRAKKILQNKDRMLTGIDRKVGLLCGELCGTGEDEGILEAAAMPGRMYGMPSGGRTYGDNTDVLLRYYRQKVQRHKEIKLRLCELSRESEEILRLWDCFLALPEPYYGILYELYVEKKLYTEVEAGFRFGHSWFERTRKEGLELAAYMFNSGNDGLELMQAASLWEKRKAGKKGEQGCAGQMELPLGEMTSGRGKKIIRMGDVG